MNKARFAGIRVLSTSYVVGDPTDTSEVASLRRGLRLFLTSGSGNLFLMAMSEGQVGLSLTLQQLRTTQNARFSALDRAAAQLYDSLPGQIILVAGADNNGGYWAQSDYVAGATVIAAPAVDVTSLANPTDFPDSVMTDNGTSYAQPFVAGVAAQILASDPDLTGAQVTQYIVSGSKVPRWNPASMQMQTPQPLVGGPAQPTAYLLDAYGALQVLASGANQRPLCANRAWASDGTVYAERDTATHTIEPLFQLGETAAFVNVRHGGRRIEVSAQSGDRAFVRNQVGQWVETQDSATTPYGGTYLSLLQWSHDLDSAVGVTPHAGDGFVDLHVYIRDFAANTNATVDTIHVPLPNSGTYVCLSGGSPCDSALTSYTTADWRFAYSPRGDRVFVSVTTIQTQMTGASGFSPCPWEEPEAQDPSTCQSVFFRTESQGTQVHSIRIPGGADSVQWRPTGQVYWLAASEDGALAVSAEGAMTQDYVIEPLPGPYPPTGFRVNAEAPVVSNCAIVYRNVVSPGTVRHSVSSTDACLGEQGQGTIAPVAPMRHRP
jgi:hypothetical protein